MESTSKVAEIELSYRPIYKVSELPKITQSLDAYRLLKGSWNLDKIAFIE